MTTETEEISALKELISHLEGDDSIIYISRNDYFIERKEQLRSESFYDLRRARL